VVEFKREQGANLLQLVKYLKVEKQD
jgi:hypothetical protein